jgi:hypothetical protein
MVKCYHQIGEGSQMRALGLLAGVAFAVMMAAGLWQLIAVFGRPIRGWIALLIVLTLLALVWEGGWEAARKVRF